MRFTIRRMLLAVLVLSALGALSAGLTLGLRAQAAQGTENLGKQTVARDVVGDWWFYTNIKQVATSADLIIKGKVLPGDEVALDIGSLRGRLFLHFVHPVEVISVLKGADPGDTISVGQMSVRPEEGTRLEPGKQVYLFLGRVNHEKAHYAIPYDYAITQGPQGQYYVVSGRIEPKGPPELATTQQFKGMEEEVFVEELRKAMEP